MRTQHCQQFSQPSLVNSSPSTLSNLPPLLSLSPHTQHTNSQHLTPKIFDSEIENDKKIVWSSCHQNYNYLFCSHYSGLSLFLSSKCKYHSQRSSGSHSIIILWLSSFSLTQHCPRELSVMMKMFQQRGGRWVEVEEGIVGIHGIGKNKKNKK